MIPGLQFIRSIEDYDLNDKKVFLRLDLNVPLEKGKITDSTRIEEALPTIKYALGKKARVIISSHLGRPKGDTPQDREKFSLMPVAEKLQELLGVEVILFDDPSGRGAKGLLPDLNEKRILLLENSRFNPGEEKNSMEFAAQLATLTDVFINDAFGALHRAHSTTAALPSLVKDRGIGFLVRKEVQVFDKLLNDIKHPFACILGGAKISDKIKVIENLLEKVDTFVIGGAMAYTFLAAQNISVGNSLIEKDKIAFAKDLLNRLKVRNKKVILPVDHVVAKDMKSPNSRVTANAAIPEGEMGLDIGPQTIELIEKELAGAKTVFWNGPMGVFETEPYEKGTFAVAQTLAGLKAMTVVGGGDSVSAIKRTGLASKITHISTGGGASLEYLEGAKLPGLEILRIKTPQVEAFVCEEE